MATGGVWCVVGFSAAVASLTAAAAAPAGGDPATPPVVTSEGAVRPPMVRSQVSAVYPPGALSTGRSVTVELVVTVLADGRVGPVEVARSGGF